MQICKITSEDTCERLSGQLEKVWRHPRTAGQRRILMAFYEIGAVRYVIFEGKMIYAAVAIKKKWNNFHVLQLGSVRKGYGRKLVQHISKLSLELVATTQSKGFWIRMDFVKKAGPYHNVFVNNI